MQRVDPPLTCQKHTKNLILTFQCPIQMDQLRTKLALACIIMVLMSIIKMHLKFKIYEMHHAEDKKRMIVF